MFKGKTITSVCFDNLNIYVFVFVWVYVNEAAYGEHYKYMDLQRTMIVWMVYTQQHNLHGIFIPVLQSHTILVK